MVLNLALLSLGANTGRCLEVMRGLDSPFEDTLMAELERIETGRPLSWVGKLDKVVKADDMRLAADRPLAADDLHE